MDKLEQLLNEIEATRLAAENKIKQTIEDSGESFNLFSIDVNLHRVCCIGPFPKRSDYSYVELINRVELKPSDSRFLDGSTNISCFNSFEKEVCNG